MNCSVTLTAEEFKVLHNSLCDLNGLAYHHHVPKVEEIVERIRKVALKSAYEQENQDFDAKWQHYDRVRSQLGLRSNWSLYQVADLDQRHPFEGAAYVVYDEHWGESGEIVKAINGRTWAALWVAADSAIRDSGDGHHCFIESFTPITDKPGHLRLHTGS